MATSYNLIDSASHAELTVASHPRWLVGVSRFIVLLSLAIWLGGIIFLGVVAAPLVFKLCRANGAEVLAPQIVGAMVTRFNVVLYICGGLLLLGWIGEKAVQGIDSGRAHKLWLVQGVCSTLMLLIALYAGLLLMPRLNSLQAQLIPQWTQASKTAPAIGLSVTPPPGVDKTLKTEFDAGHQLYQKVTMLGWWLGLAVLLCLSLRSALPALRTASVSDRLNE